MISFIRRHRVVSLVVFLNVVVILLIVLLLVIHNMKTATIDILVAPSDATIELNGTKYDNLKSHSIMPGEYHVKISMDGMETKEFDVGIEDGELKRIWTYLLDSESDFSYYVTHPDEISILGEVADVKAEEFIVEYNRLNAIQEVLPLQFSNTFDKNATEVISISVRWGVDDECDEKAFCLIVHDFTGKNTERALQLIKEAGFNPNDYELVYEKGENE